MNPPMSDPKTALTVRVTAEHIKAGRRRDCRLCPVALALKDATGVGWKVTGTWAHRYSRHVELPLKATLFIDAFDGWAGGVIKPFTFKFPWKPAAKGEKRP